MEDQDIKNNISYMINSINPYDQLERNHIEDITTWIASGENIFRIKKDATPPKHLVSFSVVADIDRRKILLLDHKKAQLMLPSGGHINKNELPFSAAERELGEELSLYLKPMQENKKNPFFATVTETVGINEKHTDVSLWYIFQGDSIKDICQESNDFKREFEGWHWLKFDEILSSPINKFDPHMHRFVQKLNNYLD